MFENKKNSANLKQFAFLATGTVHVEEGFTSSRQSNWESKKSKEHCCRIVYHIYFMEKSQR